MVIEIFRHGAREPVYDYYNPDYFSSKGELTSVGMRQHYVLGSTLRKEYIEKLHFLSEHYNASEIRVYSTNYNRTIMSAMSQLYGLYPLGTGSTIPFKIYDSNLWYPPYNIERSDFDSLLNESLPYQFQPIPIHVFNENNILYQECPNREKIAKERLESKEVKTLNKEIQENMLELANSYNLTKEDLNIESVKGIYDVYQNYLYAGFDIPISVTSDLYTNMSFIYDITYQILYLGNERQKKIESSQFLKELITLFDNKLKGIEKMKWIMYSAHDTTLLSILAGLNLTNYECLLEYRKENKKPDLNCFSYPTYASNLFFELFQNDLTDEYYVKIKYNGNIIKEFSYVNFHSYLNERIVSDYDSLCGIDEAKQITTYNIVWFSVGFALAGILSALLYYNMRKKLEESRPFRQTELHEVV